MKNLFKANLIGILFLYFLFPQKLFAQITSEKLGCGIYKEGGGTELVDCGTVYIATKPDGTKWKCVCDCANDENPCEQIDGSGTTVSGGTNSGPTQAELDAYYNAEWSGYLYEQANKEFEKGKKSYEKGNCKKAAKQFDNARKFASHSLYDKYYELAVNCRDNKNGVVVTNSTPPVISQSTTSTGVNVNPSGRRRTDLKLSKEDSLARAEVKVEQDLLNENPALWVSSQKDQINTFRDQEKNESVDEITLALRKAEADQKKMEALSPKNFSNLSPGDVILVGPDEKNAFSKGQAYLDAMTIDANAYVTHTLTCVKTVKGKKIFLDNQGDQGPRLISEEEMKKKYGSRETSVAKMRDQPWGVAQPVSKVEADSIWTMAKRLAEGNENNPQGFMTKNNYGLWGDDQIVCSEASWILVNVTGRYKIPVSNNLLVNGVGLDYTPASFFKDQEYFLITKLKMDK